MKYRVEDVLALLDQRIYGLCKELAEKIDEAQVGLQAVRRQGHEVEEPPENPRTHGEGPSRRAPPHFSGRGADQKP
jgi:hypothetical protein